MANERDDAGAKKDDGREQENEPGRKRVIGKGMTSPDSTQVPLKAETGEPDYDAIEGRIPPDEDKSQSKRPS
jgi:hypothetical protein